MCVCVCILECAWKQPTDVPYLDLINKQKVIWVTNTAYSIAVNNIHMETKSWGHIILMSLQECVNKFLLSLLILRKP